jgi:uncharacterized protein YjbJ (UPF0337 family)
MKVSNPNDPKRGESNPSSGNRDELNRDDPRRATGNIENEEGELGRDDEITSADEGFIAQDEEYNRSYETRGENKFENKLKGKWDQYVGAAKTAWGKLTRDELLETEGEEQRLTALIQERYGIDRDSASQQVRNFLNKY